MSKKKTTKSTQTTNQTATTTPNVPDWILKPYQTSATRVGGLQAMDPMSFAPDSTPALDKVWSDAGNLRGGDYSGATGLLDGVNYDLTGTRAKDFMGDYRDLFADDVINPVLDDFDEQAGQVRAAQAAAGARNGAFRGGRWGLREGQTEGELARGRASTYGGLLKDAANFALQAGTGDAGRVQAAQEGNRGARFQGAGLLSDITSRRGADERAALDMRGRFASQQTDLANARRRAPLDVEKELQGLLSGLNIGAFTGATTNSSGTTTGTGVSKESDPLGAAGKAAQIASIIFSDRRLKRDVVRLGERADGLGIYAYRYLWSPVRRIGVMAQEVLGVKPDAVIRHPSGFLMVDYGRL